MLWPSMVGRPRPLVALACGSRSTSSTRAPRSARHAERLTDVVVFPTPPFWFATAIIFIEGGSLGEEGRLNRIELRGRPHLEIVPRRNRGEMKNEKCKVQNARRRTHPEAIFAGRGLFHPVRQL